jgi:DMSO/TMAO reductase YedYZ molybdopterin-dependent catalytic subunit
MREDVIIAYEKDGVSLAERTRLVIPGANGSEWISGIIQIIIL